MLHNQLQSQMNNYNVPPSFQQVVHQAAANPQYVKSLKEEPNKLHHVWKIGKTAAAKHHHGKKIGGSFK
jgi:hypothetical protein